MKRTPYLSQRQEDGSYLVLASDGAWLHRLGVVRGEWVTGPKKGRSRRWTPSPEAGLQVETSPAHTLGEARGRLTRAWAAQRKSPTSPEQPRQFARSMRPGATFAGEYPEGEE